MRPGRAEVERVGAQRRVLAPQPQQVAGGRQQVGARRRPAPTAARRSRCPGVGVVVAALGAAQLVAGGEHRRAGGEQQGGEQVAHATCGAAARSPATAPSWRRRPTGVALDARGSTTVVVRPVAVLLAVGLVVLVVVGHEVGEREAVVRGDVVDRRHGPAHQRRVAGPNRSALPARRVARSRRPRISGQPVRARPGSRPARTRARRCGTGRSTPPSAAGTPGPPAAGPHVPGLGHELETRAAPGRSASRPGTGGRGRSRTASRPSVTARSNRNPSTPTTSRPSSAASPGSSGSPRGRRKSSVLPVPVTSASAAGEAPSCR